jgi:hypothetical protein
MYQNLFHFLQTFGSRQPNETETATMATNIHKNRFQNGPLPLDKKLLFLQASAMVRQTMFRNNFTN